MSKTKKATTVTTILLRAGGACEIRLGWLTEVYAGFQRLAQKLEQRLRPKLKKGQTILWLLNYHLADDDPDSEHIPLPWVDCKVFIVDQSGKRSEPFEGMCFTWGPLTCLNPSEPLELRSEAEVIEAAMRVLLV